MEKRFSNIRKVLIIVLLLNWAVAAAKVIYGFITKCTSMRADGFHSFADGTSNIIGLIGIWVASQPTDKDHPYGHKKYETFTSIIIAILLFVVTFDLIHEGISRLSNPIVPDVTAISFIVMICTIAVNIIVFAYEYMRSKSLNSDILKADSLHTRSDILVSVSVIFTLLAIRAGFPIIDTIVSIAIAIFIAYGAYEILKESSNVLCDRAAIVSDEIKNIVLGIRGVKNCHRIRTRGRLDDIHADLHILVDTDMNVGDAHRLNDEIEKAIRAKIQGISDIAIHIEPYDKKHRMHN
jgi:cation diffusion facilitator family transporter